MSKDNNIKMRKEYEKKVILAPKFIKILGKGIAIGLAVALVINILATLFMNMIYKRWMDEILDRDMEATTVSIIDKEKNYSNREYESEGIDAYIGRNLSEYKDFSITPYEPAYITKLEDIMFKLRNTFYKNDSGMYLFEAQLVDVEGNKISDSFDKICVDIWSESGKGKKNIQYAFDITDDSNVLPVDKIISYEEESNKNKDISYRYESDGFYLKDNDFLPGEIKVIEEKYTGEANNSYYDGMVIDYSYYDERVIETIPVTADVTGYTYIEKQEQDENFSVVYIPLLTKHFMDPDGKRLSCDSLDNSDYIKKNHIYYDGGVKETLFYYANYDLFKDFGRALIAIYIAVLIITFIGVFIICRRVYNKKKVIYDMNSYRRTVTNAMAHDLKSPLMAISGYAENMAQSQDNEKNAKYSNAIMETVDSMDNTISDLLMLSKSEQIGDKLNITNENIRTMVEECVKKYDLEIARKKLRVGITGEGEISCDRKLMLHVIDNLFSNAMKFTYDEGRFSVDISSNEIIFVNEYEGKIENDSDKLLNPFVKGDNSRKDVKGSGVGLSIVNNLVTAMGYKFDIEIKKEVFVAKIKMK